MTAFHFELVSPEKLVFSGEVEQVVVPGCEGDFTVLKDHASLMTILRPGVVDIACAKENKRLYVRGGFADVAPTGLTILAEYAVPVDELDASILDMEIKVAEDLSVSAESEEERRIQGDKLSRLREIKINLGL